ncbi:MAG: C40 family peptidase [Armatimonadetes bacterium]|nr:C40 family peptidase [Armatimonadota bacterium]
MHGTITKNVAAMYAETTRNSEQVSQAIMGQPVEIEKEEGGWLYIRTWDGYHGWIEARWVREGEWSPARIAAVLPAFSYAYRAPDASSGHHTILVVTAAMEALGTDGKFARVRLPDGREAWVPANEVSVTPAGDQMLPFGATGAEIVETGRRFIGVPYLWGGSSPFGIDCSGFVQLSYKLNGIHLLRDAGIQAGDPRAVPVEKGDLVAGDLVFFAGGEDKARITHVGMAVGDGTFIHSSGGAGVGINRLTDEPYEANYWGARRMPGV